MCRYPESLGRQRGASLIEFAFVLPLLLMILIGTFYFGYLYVLQTAATHAAQQAVIAAVAVEPVGYQSTEAYQSKVRSVVADTVFRSLEWLPASIGTQATEDATLCSEDAEEDGLATCSFGGASGSQLTVTVTINVAGGSSPLLPQVTLPPFGQVPPQGLTLVTGVAKIEL